eukprot:4419284-Pyramimonas_sp.AAC.1
METIEECQSPADSDYEMAGTPALSDGCELDCSDDDAPAGSERTAAEGMVAGQPAPGRERLR